MIGSVFSVQTDDLVGGDWNIGEVYGVMMINDG